MSADNGGGNGSGTVLRLLKRPNTLRRPAAFVAAKEEAARKQRERELGRELEKTLAALEDSFWRLVELMSDVPLRRGQEKRLLEVYSLLGEYFKRPEDEAFESLEDEGDEELDEVN